MLPHFTVSLFYDCRMNIIFSEFISQLFWFRFWEFAGFKSQGLIPNTPLFLTNL